jgi:hypothetical protein
MNVLHRYESLPRRPGAPLLLALGLLLSHPWGWLPPGSGPFAFLVPSGPRTLLAQAPPAAPDPLPLRIVPSGRLLRVQLDGGERLDVRFMAPGDPVRLALPGGEVVEVDPERIVRVTEVRGTVREGRTWLDPGPLPSLLPGAQGNVHLQDRGGSRGVHLGGGVTPGARPRLAVAMHRTLAQRGHLEVDARVGAAVRELQLPRESACSPERDVCVEGAPSRRAIAEAHLSVAARWEVLPGTGVQVALGVPHGIEVELSQRTRRRWGAAIGASATPSARGLSAIGVRYFGEALTVEAGMARVPGEPGPRLHPALQVVRRGRR